MGDGFEITMAIINPRGTESSSNDLFCQLTPCTYPRNAKSFRQRYRPGIIADMRGVLDQLDFLENKMQLPVIGRISSQIAENH